ncbi:putative Heterokaryon incompatibility domain-containing protein [Seiridium cardinale]
MESGSNSPSTASQRPRSSDNAQQVTCATRNSATGLRNLYESLPLGKSTKSIRVFDLEPPKANSPDDAIRGELRVVRLDDGPKYVALSYVWGTSSNPSRTIFAGQHAINVTDNCWDALWYLRNDALGKGKNDPGRDEDGTITLWIDSICINQGDDDEKLEQIPLMGDVYTYAASVCIWLGKGTKAVDQAAEYLKVAGFQDMFTELNEFFYEIPVGRMRWKAAFQLTWLRSIRMFLEIFQSKNPISQYRKLRTKILKRGFIDIHEPPPPMGIAQIFGAAWVDRIWTLQEATLAHKPWVLCGTNRIDWRSMMYGAAFVDWTISNMDQPIFSGNGRHWRRLISVWLSFRKDRTGNPMADYIAFLDQTMKAVAWIGGAPIFALGFVLNAVSIPFVPVFIADQTTALWVALTIFGTIALLGFLAWFHLPTYFSRSKVYRGRDVYTEGVLSGITIVAQELRRRRATESKDKSFGVHAVLQKLGTQLADPDDSASCGDLYRELFLRLLENTQDLNLLLYASGSVSGQPSWVPDWDTDVGKDWLDPSGFLRPSTAPPARLEDVWGYCTRFSKPDYEISQDGGFIIGGLELGRISWRGEPFIKMPDLVPNDKPPINIKQLPVPEQETHVHNLNIIWTLMRRWDPPLNIYSEARYVFHQQKTRSAPDMWWHMLTRPLTTESEFLERFVADRNAWDFHISSVCNSLAQHRRTLFFCEGDIFPSIRARLGNCPVDAETGDIVALIAGVSLPVLLRPHSNMHSYRLVGYVTFDAGPIMWGGWWLEELEANGARNWTRYSLC